MVDMVEGDISDEWLFNALASPVVGMDIETSGLNKSTDRIATVQMYVPDKGTVMVRKMSGMYNVIKLLEDKNTRKIFHFGTFDLAFLMRDYNVYPANIADTHIAAKLLDPKKRVYKHPETLKGSHSLIALVHYYIGEILDKKIAVSNWFAEDLTPAQIDYAAKDVIYLPLILKKMETELSKLGLLRLARKTMRHVPTDIMLQLKNYESLYIY